MTDECKANTPDAIDMQSLTESTALVLKMIHVDRPLMHKTAKDTLDQLRVIQTALSEHPERYADLITPEEIKKRKHEVESAMAKLEYRIRQWKRALP